MNEMRTIEPLTFASLHVRLIHVNEKRTSGSDDLLSAKDASQLLPGVGYQALLRWARSGEVAHVRLPNGRVFFRRSDIEVLLEPSDIPVDRPLPGLGRVRG